MAQIVFENAFPINTQYALNIFNMFKCCVTYAFPMHYTMTKLVKISTKMYS